MARTPPTSTPLTSTSNPLRIAEIAVGSSGGRIGITFAPGKQQPDGLTGAHRRDLGADLDAIAAWNAAVVVTLVEPHELDSLGIAALGAEVRRRHMEWHHWPIQDYSVPDAAFEATWPARSAALRSLLACGGRVLIHCKGGLGRAGTISARLLVEGGMVPGDAIRAVRAVRPRAIETGPQAEWVRAGRAVPPVPPARDRNAARDRAVGALLGLAVGDAVGAAIEFSPKPRFAVLDDMTQGGPHRLARGQWTDDTAMALADSLALAPGLDPADLMRRFLDWRDTGAYSCTGTCFDIGNATRIALERFRRTGEPLAGSADPAASGNGALMRLAPVAIRHWRDREVLQRVAALQTRTTHGSPATLAASAVFADMLADAIAGAPLPEVLASAAAGRIDGGWRGLHRDTVEGSGWVVQALQAAVWALSRTTDFGSAVLLAANLGNDADTTAAIAGQLAGAIYGVAGIPPGWLDALAWRGRLEGAAASLFDAAWPEADGPGHGNPYHDGDGTAAEATTLGDGFAARWMTRDWTMRERLAALAGFRTMFERDGFQFATQVPAERNGDLIVLGWTSLGDEAWRFYQMVYHYGWVRMLDWTTWRDTAAGRRLMHNPDAMAYATEDDLVWVLTTCLRADRFCEGYLAEAYDAGLIGRVVLRAGQLLRALEARFGLQP